MNEPTELDRIAAAATNDTCPKCCTPGFKRVQHEDSSLLAPGLAYNWYEFECTACGHTAAICPTCTIAPAMLTGEQCVSCWVEAFDAQLVKMFTPPPERS